MGEDRALAEKKDALPPPSRQRRPSSCSEDSEATASTGHYTPTPEDDTELEYGPGIVNKLRTRFLSITLMQNRGAGIRRSCSMENLLDQDRPTGPRGCDGFGGPPGDKGPEVERGTSPWGNLKRAKSMDTLLMDLQLQQQQQEAMTAAHHHQPDPAKKEPKIVRAPTRTGPTICDEELPKPDTVKTYKRMFEPAESRRASYSRKPPVLRASAKSGSQSVAKTNGALPPCAKVNGIAPKSKPSAKPSPPVKAQSDSENVLGSQPLMNGGEPKPLCNGSYMKATPVKIADGSPFCNGKVEKTLDKEVNGLNGVNNKDAPHSNQKKSVVCNGNSVHKDLIKHETKEDYVKPDVKKLVNQTYKVHNGSDNKVTSALNGLNVKPKVPPNRPNFIKNVKPGTKIADLNGIEKKAPLIPKLKPTPNSIHRKIQDKVKSEIGQNKVAAAAVIGEPRTNGDASKPESPGKEAKTDDDESIVDKNNKRNAQKIEPEKTQEVAVKPRKEPDAAEIVVNGDEPDNEKPDSEKLSKSEKSDTLAMEVRPEPRPAKKPQQQSSADPITTSMVFDFRGKDVVAHVALLPVPFGCKALHPKKKTLLVDGKETPNGVTSDDEDEYSADYSVPPPSGVVFEGENVRIGKGSILSSRNKDLKIKFDDNVDDNTFVYPSETSLMEDSDQSLSPSPPPSEVIPNGQPPPSKLKSNPAIGSSGAGGLSTYTPSVLRTMDNFEPGMFRPHPAVPEKEDDKKAQSGEEENTEVRDDSREQEMLKPADPEIISSWSLSAGTSDLLF